jgi:acetyl esterase/lipase
MLPSHLLLATERVGSRHAYGPDGAQFIDVYPADARYSPMVAALHGGYWREAYDGAHLGHLCAALAANGISTASIEYRRLGQKGGGWPGTFEDIALALDALPDVASSIGADASRIVLLGHSAGGQLALWAASRGRLPGALRRPALRLRGVVALAAVSDLVEASRLNLSDGAARQLLGGGPEAFPARYCDASPLALLPLGIPTTVVHGTKDADVPYGLSEAYVEAARAAGDAVRFVPLEGANHFDVIDPLSPFWPKVLEAIQAELQTKDVGAR